MSVCILCARYVLKFLEYTEDVWVLTGLPPIICSLIYSGSDCPIAHNNMIDNQVISLKCRTCRKYAADLQDLYTFITFRKGSTNSWAKYFWNDSGWLFAVYKIYETFPPFSACCAVYEYIPLCTAHVYASPPMFSISSWLNYSSATTRTVCQLLCCTNKAFSPKFSKPFPLALCSISHKGACRCLL